MLFLLLGLSLQSFAPQPYARLVAFGDSYSDNGNLAYVSGGVLPNATRYYRGRFTDGPVWVERLAQLLNLDSSDPSQFLDFAYANAKIRGDTTMSDHHNPPRAYGVPGLATQIDAFVAEHREFAPQDVVVVFISANDFFDWQEAPDAHAFLLAAAQEQVEQIERLHYLGARHIVVLNGRDVTHAPLAAQVAEQHCGKDGLQAQDAYLEYFAQLIRFYNQQLQDGLRNMHDVLLYDTFAFDNRIIRAIAQGGYAYVSEDGQYHMLKNARAGCYSNDHGDYDGIAGAVCATLEEYFYYDRIHTTRNVGYLLAEDVFQQMSAN